MSRKHAPVVFAKQKCGSGISDLWKSWRRWNAEVDLPIFGSPGRTSVEDVWDLSSPGRAEVRKAELQIFGSEGSAKCGSATSQLSKSGERWIAEVDLPILGSPGRTSVKDERDLSKSWRSGSTESGTSDLWQSRQSRSAEAELHIFGSPGSDEMRKWTYPYLEVLVEQVRKKNEIFWSPGRAEVRKAELLIFGSKDRAELRKQSFRPLKVLAEQSWCADAELHIVSSQGRTEVRKQNSHLTKNWQSRSVERISCHIIDSQTKWKCGSRISNLWQSYQVGSVEAELYIFDRSLSYWLPLPMLTNNSTDCYNCHSQWRTMWRPGVAKTQDFRNAFD